MTTTISQPKIDERPAQPYMGIREQVPFKGMFREITRLFKALNAWARQQSLEPAGPPFLRYHVIDMSGQMDIEAGLPVTVPLPEDDPVRVGVLPAGRYASLVYNGSGLAGNKALIDWARANRLAWDRWDDTNGDAFRCRYETYLTDQDVEPRKTRWKIEVAIKLSDDQAA